MSWYLPPSKTPPTEEEIERFNLLYQNLMERMQPEGEEEISLAEQVIVAQWFYRQQNYLWRKTNDQLNALAAAGIPAGPEMRETLSRAAHQAQLQKNFAFRRRGKLIRMQRNRISVAPLAA
jgi:hypothetical protein